MNTKDRLRLIETAGISSAGKRNLIRHLRGERLARNAAIVAKCCDCMGYHGDGRMDCRTLHCPLYPFRPYKEDPAVSQGEAILPRRMPSTSDSGHTTPQKRGNGRQDALSVMPRASSAKA